jgi:hypothetical protein
VGGAGEMGSGREALWRGGGSAKVHDRCYRMRMLDQINVLVAVADGVRSGSMGSRGSTGVRTEEMNLCRS